jgi:hypothetical protein
MDNFNQLHNKIYTLIQKYNGDTITISHLSNIDNYITQQEKYYNSIPDNIKTNNTLKYIIEKILFRINQIEFKKNPKIIIMPGDYTTDNTTDMKTTIFVKEADRLIKELRDTHNKEIAVLIETLNITKKRLEAAENKIRECERIINGVRNLNI